MGKVIKNEIGIRGFFRLKITEKGKVVGKTGWLENLMTNVGVEKFLHAFSGTTGTLQVSHISVGTGGTPASDATTLPGEGLEASKRAAVSLASSLRAASNGTSTMQFAATLASADSFITIAQNISNIGLFNSVTSGSLMAGNTYASSALATNQNIEMSYQIQMNSA